VGTDIHMWVEARDNEDAPWRLVVPEHSCLDCFGEELGADYTPPIRCPWCDDTRAQSSHIPRDNDLFARLAGVRNRNYAGGHPRASYSDVISNPRGFPDDLSEGLRAHLSACELWVDGYAPALLDWPGDHSASWITLREAIEYITIDTTWRGEFLAACCKLGSPTNVRLIFNFDS